MSLFGKLQTAKTNAWRFAMLAHMKTQTTGSSTDICLTVPTADASQVLEAIENILSCAGHTVRRVNEDGEELFSSEEVLTEATPGMALLGLRVREGITQKELAERLGIKQHRVSEMERGIRRISMDMAKRIGEAYNISHKVFL
jgi:DNA-binding XRE family transcriptional regulator